MRGCAGSRGREFGCRFLQHVDDPIQHGGYDRRGRHPFLVGQADPFASVEVPQKDHLSTGVHVGQCRADTGDVVRRHADECCVARLRGVELDGPGDVAGQIVVGEFDSLGCRRRARGEQDDGHRIRIGEAGKRFGDSGGREEVGGRHDSFAVDDVAVFLVDHDEWIGQPFDERANTVGGEPVVQRRHGDASARRRTTEGEHLRARTDIGHMPGAGAADHARGPVGESAEFGCRPADVAGNQRLAVGLRGLRHFQQQRDGHGVPSICGGSTKMSHFGSSPPP